jgi:hypothetical protein
MEAPHRGVQLLHFRKRSLPAVFLAGLPAVLQAGHGALRKDASSGSNLLRPVSRPESRSALH